LVIRMRKKGNQRRVRPPRFPSWNGVVRLDVIILNKGEKEENRKKARISQNHIEEKKPPAKKRHLKKAEKRKPQEKGATWGGDIAHSCGEKFWGSKLRGRLRSF